MSILEKLQTSGEFEQKPIEREQTYQPIFPDRLAQLRESAVPIRQIYLSGTNEPCDFRFRETTDFDGITRYEVGIKGAETFTDGARERLELVDGMSVSKELFDFYTANVDLPTVHKLRAKPNAYVAVDFYEDGEHVEVEKPLAGDAFFDSVGGKQGFVEVTGDRSASNRWRAELEYRRTHDGTESHPDSPELTTDAMVADILQARLEAVTPLIVTIAGRSGSGKSTVIHELRSKLAEVGLTSDVTSTDDYHRGKTWLEGYNNGEPWQRWDDEIVYNLRALVEDLESYREGNTIPRLAMNWVSQDPEVSGVIKPVDVLLVEGIYAGSLEVSRLSNLEFELPTPLATCIWRRMLRDAKERPIFADYEVSLRYILEQAEPAYRAQKSKRAAAERGKSS